MHEEDGHWFKRLLFCRHCKFEYEQEQGEDDNCPLCGSQDYYVLEEYEE